MFYDFDENYENCDFEHPFDQEEYAWELERLRRKAEAGEGVLREGVFTVSAMKAKRRITGEVNWFDQKRERDAKVRYEFPNAGENGESIYRLDLKRSSGGHYVGTCVESDWFLACLVNDALNHNEQEEAWSPGTYRINLAPAAERLGVNLCDVAQPGMVRTNKGRWYDKIIAQYDGRDIVAVDGDQQTLPVEALYVIVYTKETIAADPQTKDEKYDHVRHNLEAADWVIVSVQAWAEAEDAEMSKTATPWRVVNNMIQDFDKPESEKRVLTKEDLEASVELEKNYSMVAYPHDRY